MSGTPQNYWVHPQDAAIIELYFIHIHIVIQDHALAADNDGTAQLAGRQPTYLEMSDGTGRKLKSQGRNVEQLPDTSAARSGDTHGGFLHPVQEHREIMGSEVPHDVYIAPMNAKVDAIGAQEIQMAQLTAIVIFADFAHRRAVNEGMAHHQRRVFLLREFDQFFTLAGGCGQRFFYKDTLPALESRFSHIEVAADRGGDHYCIACRHHLRQAL